MNGTNRYRQVCANRTSEVEIPQVDDERGTRHEQIDQRHRGRVLDAHGVINHEPQHRREPHEPAREYQQRLLELLLCRIALRDHALAQLTERVADRIRHERGLFPDYLCEPAIYAFETNRLTGLAIDGVTVCPATPRIFTSMEIRVKDACRISVARQRVARADATRRRRPMNCVKILNFARSSKNVDGRPRRAHLVRRQARALA